MRKPEQKQWDYLAGAMRGLWHAQRHEDRYSKGIPDVSYAMRGIDGWLELKTISAWPKNPSAPVVIEHLDSIQVNWVEERGRAGTGRVWLFLLVGRPDSPEATWTLVPWFLLRTLYERVMTYDDLSLQCVMMSSKALRDYLPDHLTDNPHRPTVKLRKA